MTNFSRPRIQAILPKTIMSTIHSNTCRRPGKITQVNAPTVLATLRGVAFKAYTMNQSNNTLIQGLETIVKNTNPLRGWL